jgi:hypothetical protein
LRQDGVVKNVAAGKPDVGRREEEKAQPDVALADEEKESGVGEPARA